MKDYYKILGIEQNASKEDISRAFKALAKIHHPDVNNGSDTKFKEISEAYGILSDDNSRAKYDNSRDYGNRPSQEDVNDVFNRFNGAFGRKQFHRQGHRKNNFVHGFEEQFDFDSLFNRPRAVSINVALRVAFTGGQVMVHGIDGSSAIPVRIPPRTAPGTILSVATRSHGEVGIQINVEPGDGFIFNGNNLETSVNVNIGTSILGGKVKVKDPAGTEFVVTVPPGTNHASMLSLQGQGLGNANLLVRINVSMPKNLSQDAIDALNVFIEKANIK